MNVVCSLRFFGIAALLSVSAWHLQAGILHVNGKDEFNEQVLDSKQPVIVKYSTNWCGYCKLVEGPCEEFAKKHPEIKFVQVDIDKKENKELYSGGVPYFAFYDIDPKTGKAEKANDFTGASKELVNNFAMFEKLFLSKIPSLNKNKKIAVRKISTEVATHEVKTETVAPRKATTVAKHSLETTESGVMSRDRKRSKHSIKIASHTNRKHKRSYRTASRRKSHEAA